MQRRTVLQAASLLPLASVLPEPAPLPFSKRQWGSYVEAAGGSDGSPWELASLRALETQLGYRFPLVSGFVPAFEVPLANLRTLAKEGRTSVLSYDVNLSFKRIITGDYDARFRKVASQLATIPGPVYLRLWAEMNGNWATWSVASSAARKRHVASTAEWIAAWRHVVDLFRAVAPNVCFIWCPNVTDEGSTALESYWPGAAWVDVLGFDGYNWGSPWQTHQQIFTPIYNRLAALDPALPIWVGETGSAEGSAGRKATWLTNLLQETGYPRLAAFCYFSVDKERDWRLDSSPASLAAARAGFAGRA